MEQQMKNLKNKGQNIGNNIVTKSMKKHMKQTHMKKKTTWTHFPKKDKHFWKPYETPESKETSALSTLTFLTWFSGPWLNIVLCGTKLLPKGRDLSTSRIEIVVF